MEQGLQAFFYDYKYYLLPAEYPTAEDLKKRAEKGGVTIEARRLKEERCMAPDFVYEGTDTEKLTISAPGRVFPVSVSLYTREEYDALLRPLVEKRCPGCVNYSGEAGDLQGHHREMSLKGVCYIRMREGENFSFAFMAAYCWDLLSEKKEKLAALIDGGDHKKLTAEIGGVFRCFCPPFETYGGKDEEGYFLCIGYGYYPADGLRVIVGMLADTAERFSRFGGEGWRVYPYFPKGIYRPRLRPDYFARPPRIFVSDDPSGGARVCVCEKGVAEWTDKQANMRRKAIYAYLCSIAGEDLLLASASALSVSDAPPPDGVETDAGELADLLSRRAAELYEGEKIPFPSPVFFGVKKTEEAELLPGKEDAYAWTTVCREFSPEIPFETEKDGEKKTEGGADGGDETDFSAGIAALYEELGVGYAYIILPESGSFSDVSAEEKKEILDWYFMRINEYPAPVRQEEDGKNFAVQVGAVRTPFSLCVDFMIFDEKEFFRTARMLAPVLEGLGAKIVTVKREGAEVYSPGYVIRPVGAGLQT